MGPSSVFGTPEVASRVAGEGLELARRLTWTNGNTGADRYFRRWAYSLEVLYIPYSRPEHSAHMMLRLAPPSPERLQA
jgi:hypothetical protein